MALIDDVRSVAADVFGIAPDLILPQSSPESLPGWDSVQHLSLVLALESRFSVSFDPEDIEKMKNIETITGLVQQRVGTRH